MKQGLDRAAGIVRQVLAHADPAKAPRTPVDLNQVLRETEQFVQSRKEFRHVDFALDLSDGPLVVHGNPVMLGQVAMNLIVNACEVQPGQGEVRVTSRRDGGAGGRGVRRPRPGHPRGRPPARLRAVLLDQGLDRPRPVDLSYHRAAARRRARRRPAGGAAGSVFRMRLPATGGLRR